MTQNSGLNMQLADVESQIEKIRAVALEDHGEDAKELEDKLFLNVLRAIAGGATNAKELATAAIQSADIEMNRWYE